MAADPPPRKVFFENLDGLRFLSFLGVFFYHAYRRLAPPRESGAFDAIRSALTLNGHSGEAAVSFFFVLSGFLITYLMLDEQETTGRFSVKNFYVRRTLRIWPLYYAVILFGFVVAPALSPRLGLPYRPETASFTWFALYLANFDVFFRGFPANGMLGVQWSLAIEEQFYVVWPLLFALCSTRRHPRRAYQTAFTLVILGSLVFRFFYIARPFQSFNTLSVMCDLGVGGWLAYLAFYRAGVVGQVGKLSTAAIVGLYGLGLSLTMWQGRLFADLGWLKELVLALFFAFVILEQNDAARSFYKMSRFPLATRLGTYTYGLYSLHMIGITVATALLPKDSSLLAFLARLSVAAGLTLGMSLLSYRYFESYFLGLKKRFA